MPPRKFDFFEQIDSLVGGFAEEVSEAVDVDGAEKLTILEFIDKELDIGITLTDQQRTVLKSFYGLPLDPLEISILESWASEERTTWNWDDNHDKPSQMLILEAGRRSGKCARGDFLVPTREGLKYGWEFAHPELARERPEALLQGQPLQSQQALAQSLGLTPETWYPLSQTISTEAGHQAQATQLFAKGTTATRRITTRCGYEIEATPEHRIKVMDIDGQVNWRYLRDIRPGDQVCLNRSTHLFPQEEVEVSSLVPALSPNSRPFQSFPTTLNADWGYLLGLLVANGSWTRPGSIEITLHRQDVPHYIEALGKCGIAPGLRQDKRRQNTFSLSFHSVQLRSFLDSLGWKRESTPSTKLTPWVIRRSPQHVQASYITGLFDGDGCAECKGKSVTMSTASLSLARETQLLLLNFGIVCHLSHKTINGRVYQMLRLRGRRSVVAFIQAGGFRLPRKRQLVLDNLARTTKEGGDTEALPHQGRWLRRVRDFLSDWGQGPRQSGASPRMQLRAIVGNSVKLGSQEEFSSTRLEALLAFLYDQVLDPSLIRHFERLQTLDYAYDPVISVEESTAYCLDLSVPGPETYVSQGFTNHNTQSASIIAAYELYCLARLPNPHAVYGIAYSTPIAILVMATTADQGKDTIFGAIAGVLQNCRYFQRLIDRKELLIGKEMIEIPGKRLVIKPGNSKSASQVGYTIKCLIMDEVARFRDADGESNALEIWSNVGIGSVTFGQHAIRVAISSAWYEGDAIQKLYESCGRMPGMMGFRLRSWDMNPLHASRDNPVVMSEYATDPMKAALEFEGLRSSSAGSFMNSFTVDKAVRGLSTILASPITHHAQGINVAAVELIKIRPDHRNLLCHLDPSISGDTYGGALAHGEWQDGELLVVVDGLLAWEPTPGKEVSITNVYDTVLDIHRKLGLRQVTADHHGAAAETLQRLKQRGVNTKRTFFSASLQLAMFEYLRRLMTEDRLILPKDSFWTATLIRELKQLVLIRGRKIDHPRGGSKDIADCVAALAWEIGRLGVMEQGTAGSRPVRRFSTHTAARTPRGQLPRTV